MSFLRLLFALFLACTAFFASAAAFALGTVAGQLTDMRSGAAVPGALVELGTPVFGSFVPTGQQVVSNSEGRYSMDIPAGMTYGLRVTPAAPLLSGYWPDTLCRAGSNCSFPGFGNVYVQEGGIFTADMLLTTPGGIAGRLTREFAGTPIAGLTIRLNRTGQNGLPMVQAQTDALGNYFVDGLPPGAYRVYFDNNPDYQSEIYDNVPCLSNCSNGAPGETLISVVADGMAGNIDIELARANEIAGSIRVEGHSTLQVGVGLRLDRLVDGHWVLQDSLGLPAGSSSYAFTSLTPGTYTLSTYGSNLVHNNVVYDGIDCAADTCTAEERAAGTLISLVPSQSARLNPIELQPAASMTACVHDALTAMPLPGVHVVVYSPTPAPMIGYFDYGSAVSGADGCARIDYLGEAPYGLRLRTVNGGGYRDRIYGGPDCLDNNCALGAGSLVVLGHDQNLTGINFALMPGASLAGRVLARANGPGVPNATLELIGTDGFMVRGEDLRRLRTPADGRFRTFALADGSYTLKARITNENYVTRIYTYVGGPLTISQGVGIEGIAFVLEGETVHFSGFESP